MTVNETGIARARRKRRTVRRLDFGPLVAIQERDVRRPVSEERREAWALFLEEEPEGPAAEEPEDPAAGDPDDEPEPAEVPGDDDDPDDPEPPAPVSDEVG
jgi:hypothetical protein